MAQSLLVLVPGIMCTELKNDDDVCVWGPNITTIIDTLSCKPHLLRDPAELVAGKLIRSFSLFGRLEVINVYDRLLDDIQSKMGDSYDGSFIEFPYNWALSTRKSADLLATSLRGRIEGGVNKIQIIAHSMGGLVTRLMLQDYQDVAAKVTHFVQIATPVRGASEAYKTLKHGLELPFLKLVQASIKHFYPTKHSELLDSIREFNSIFELLPHREEKILSKKGLSHCAFDEKVWHEVRKPALASAESFHAHFRKVPPCRHLSILSTGCPTEYSYDVNEDFTIYGPLDHRKGDGTVCGTSARDGSQSNRVVAISDKILHDDLPSDPRVIAMIREELWNSKPI